MQPTTVSQTLVTAVGRAVGVAMTACTYHLQYNLQDNLSGERCVKREGERRGGGGVRWGRVVATSTVYAVL